MKKIEVVLILFCLLLGQGKSSGLRDNPIVGDNVQYLDGTWKVTSDSSSHTFSAKVPGDLISDLQNAGIIPDPNYETTWLNNSGLWKDNDWNYLLSFSISVSAEIQEVLLVFDGIKMGASISLNGQNVGIANNQFLRYSFPIKKLLSPDGKPNELKVTFPHPDTIDCQGRFMACTGGWDWAPYSNTFDQHNSHTLSKGIWKSVYLVQVSSVAINHVVPSVFYKGEYPTSPLTDTDHSSFDVNLEIHLNAPTVTSGTIEVTSDWGATATSQVSLKVEDNVEMVKLTAQNVKLWWPAGLGAQNLYNVTINFVPKTPLPKLTTVRRIGFRVFALVTADDSDPSKLIGKDGSGNFTMRFKVNGVNVYSRGGNMIPMEEYESRANVDAFRYLLKSARDGNMNTLRIWGGGIFLYDIFYDVCDELGLLLYHDMMYAQGGHSPSNTASQIAEISHQVRRLSHHPSIVIWDACNECGGEGIYASFVSTLVSQVDKSRVIWPSCPSNGWNSGVDQLWGLPNGKTLDTRSQSTHFETHGPYQHGDGWPAVDGDSTLHPFPPNLPPKLRSPSKTGPSQPGVYASEFGCVTWSSFESLSPTLAPASWGLHTKAMYQRNYPCDNIIQVYFGKQDLSQVGEMTFKKQLYQCVLGSTLELEADIETRRSGNEFGTVIWQLNEIWPTGGWGSVEYGTPVKGQVVGGRWKPIHYFLRNSLFADLISTCGQDANCYVKNDGPTAFSGKVVLSIVHFDTGKQDALNTISVNLAAGAGTIQWFCAKGTETQCESWDNILKGVGCTNGGSDCIVTISVEANTGVVSSKVLPLQTPEKMVLPKPSFAWNITVNPGGIGNIALTTDHVAVYTVLSTEAAGRFSDNAFLLLPGKKTVLFYPFGNIDLPLLVSTLRIDHVQMYQ